MRLQQIHDTEPAVPYGDTGFVRADADCLLEIRDYLIDRPTEKLAPTEMGISRCAAAVERDRGLIFGDGFSAASLRPQDLALGDMRQRTVGGRRQGTIR